MILCSENIIIDAGKACTHVDLAVHSQNLLLFPDSWNGIFLARRDQVCIKDIF